MTIAPTRRTVVTAAGALALAGATWAEGIAKNFSGGIVGGRDLMTI